MEESADQSRQRRARKKQCLTWTRRCWQQSQTSLKKRGSKLPPRCAKNCKRGGSWLQGDVGKGQKQPLRSRVMFQAGPMDQRNLSKMINSPDRNRLRIGQRYLLWFIMTTAMCGNGAATQVNITTNNYDDRAPMEGKRSIGKVGTLARGANIARKPEPQRQDLRIQNWEYGHGGGGPVGDTQGYLEGVDQIPATNLDEAQQHRRATCRNGLRAMATSALVFYVAAAISSWCLHQPRGPEHYKGRANKKKRRRGRTNKNNLREHTLRIGIIVCTIIGLGVTGGCLPSSLCTEGERFDTKNLQLADWDIDHRDEDDRRRCRCTPPVLHLARAALTVTRTDCRLEVRDEDGWWEQSARVHQWDGPHHCAVQLDHRPEAFSQSGWGGWMRRYRGVALPLGGGKFEAGQLISRSGPLPHWSSPHYGVTQSVHHPVYQPQSWVRYRHCAVQLDHRPEAFKQSG